MKRIFLALFLALAPLCATFAQGSYSAPEVAISSEKANIGGKIYYIHKVEAKQTIFSICKAYGITEDELAKANPDVRKNGLKAGSLIFVPQSSSLAEAQVSAVSPAEVSATDTDAAAEPQEEPQQKTEVSEDEPQGELGLVKVIEHRIRWYESLRFIAWRYNISEDDILDFNGLENSDIRTGVILQIPVYGEVREQDDNDATEAAAVSGTDTDGNEVETDESQEAVPAKEIERFNASNPLNISLILPFNASSSKPSVNMMDFYSGALMAVNAAKEAGSHVILNVFDLASGASSILADSKFIGSDCIIGPVTPESQEPFAAFALENGIPFVSPLDQKSESSADGNPCYFFIPASQEVQLKNMVEDLDAKPSDQVFLFYNSSGEEAQYVDQVKALLDSAGIAYTPTSYAISSGRQLFSSLQSGFSKSNPAKVIVASEAEAFSADITRNLKLTVRREQAATLWCSNKVRNYDAIDPEALYLLQAHITAPYFVDYSDEATKSFILKYRALFGTEPSAFSYQGYDILTWFITAMNSLGSAVVDDASSVRMNLLQCNIAFTREDENCGWRNSATRNLVYDRETLSISTGD